MLCKQCKCLRNLFEHQWKRSDVSSARKLKRQQPSSQFKLKNLSPVSTLKWRWATQRKRLADKGSLLTLDDGQNNEWNSVKTIKEQHNGELDKVCQEANARSDHVQGVCAQIRRCAYFWWVITSLMWDWRNHQLIGLAMSEKIKHLC